MPPALSKVFRYSVIGLTILSFVLSSGCFGLSVYDLATPAQDDCQTREGSFCTESGYLGFCLRDRGEIAKDGFVCDTGIEYDYACDTGDRGPLRSLAFHGLICLLFGLGGCTTLTYMKDE